MRSKRVIITLCFLLGFLSITTAQQVEQTDSKLASQLTNGLVIPAEVDNGYNTPNTKTVDPQGFVQLKINKHSEHWYKYTLPLKMTPYGSDGQPDASAIVTQNLVVEYNPYTDKQHVDLAYYKFTGSHGVQVEVDGAPTLIDADSGNPLTGTTILDEIELIYGFKADRYFLLATQAPSIISQPSATEMLLSWNPVAGAIEYELEWTWVDNYGPDPDSPTTNADTVIPLTEKDFELNNTRIQTTNAYYRIPLVYDRGYLVYRLRALGRFLDNPNKVKPGPWSSTGGQPKNVVNDWGDKYLIPYIHQGNKNWQFQASYAEEGKKKEVVSYFDGSLRNRQTVTKINTNQNPLIVGEVIYDNQGRPAIEVLPVPVKKSVYGDSLRYIKRFNRTETAQGQPEKAYTHADFDWDDPNASHCEVELTPIVGGASDYYGPATATGTYQDHVPDADGYPFSQIEYTPDNTGRIRRKGGVGITHQLGTGHEMRYMYSKPGQKQLNRLFGYRVGNENHYKKNAVIDPNGQTSISYLDPQGRTIATALVGDNPKVAGSDPLEDLMLGLPDEDPNNVMFPHGNTTIDLLSNNTLVSTGNFQTLLDARIAARQHDVYGSGIEHTLTYTVSQTNTAFIPSIPGGACDTPYPFIYDLVISMKNDCGDEQIALGQDAQGNDFNSVTGTISQINPANPFVFNPSAGTNSIYKRLQANEDTLNQYAAAYLTSLTTPGGDCYIDPAGFAPEASLTNCDLTCTECIEQLGTKEEYIIAELKAQYGNNTFEAIAGDNSQTDATINVTVYWDDIDGDNNTTQNIDASEVLLWMSTFSEEWDLLYGICAQLPGSCITNPILDNPATFTDCDINNFAMLADMSPGGQYANTTLETVQDTQGNDVLAVTDPLSIFNEDNAFIPNGSWRTPLDGGYKDTNGALSEVIVIQNVDGSYTPAILDTATPTAAVNDFGGNYLWVRPEQLALVNDFMNVFWQSSWAEALLGYHPEYKYLEYERSICSMTGTVNGVADVSSIAFDDFVQSLDENTPNLLSELTSLGFIDSNGIVINATGGLGNADPYYANPIPLLPAPTMNTIHSDIMFDALTVNYENNSMSLQDLCLQIVACNGISSGCNPTYGGLNNSQKIEFWNVYKGMYLSLKQKIQTVLQNAYAKSQGYYNYCIGDPESGSSGPDVAQPLSVYTSQAGTINSYANNSGTANQICTAEQLMNYHEKQKRYLPIDVLYNSGDSAAQVIADMSEQGAYSYYVSTGICPLAYDLEVFLNGLATDPHSLTNGIDQNITGFTESYLVPDLYEALGGTINASTPSIDITKQVTGDTLKISVSNTTCSEQIQFTLPDTVDFPSGNTWTNYGQNDTWTILSVSNIYYVQPAVNGVYNFQALVKISTNGGQIEEFVFTGSTCVAIGDCTIGGSGNAGGNNSGNGSPQDLGSGGLYNDPCTDKENFENSMLNILNALESHIYPVTNTNEVDLSTVSAYTDDEFFPSYIGDDQSAGSIVWHYIGNDDYVIKKNGTTLLTLNIDFFNLAQTALDIQFVTVGLESENDDNIYNKIKVEYYVNNSQATLYSTTGTIDEPVECGCSENNLLKNDGKFDGGTVSENCFNAASLSAWDWTTNQSGPDGTPDLMKAYSAYSNTNAYQCYPIGLEASPQGGNYVRLLADHLNQSGPNDGGESITKNTSVGPLIPGEEYVISFYQVNAGIPDNNNYYSGEGRFKVKFGLETQFSPNMQFQGANNQIWQKVELTFTATYETQALKIRAYNPDARCSLGIDDISVVLKSEKCDDCIPQPVAPVPITPAYNTWVTYMNNKGFAVEGLYASQTEFDNMNLQYLVDSYIDYTNLMVGVDGEADEHFLTLIEFGNTHLNYGYDGINAVILAYKDAIDNSSEFIGWTDYVNNVYLEEHSVCPPVPMIPILPNVEVEDPCDDFVIEVNGAYSAAAYQAYINSLVDQFKRDYLEQAMNSVQETFTLTHYDKEYNYTLYYYDQAGNLVQTVPPAGINRLDINDETLNTNIDNHRATNGAENNAYLPDHRLKTQYRYNSLNQLVWQATPDGGETKFAYDKLGRIIASQNEKQAGEASSGTMKMSYTVYDELGRIIEAGEVSGSSNAQSTEGAYTITDDGRLQRTYVPDPLGAPGVTADEIVDAFNLSLLTGNQVTHTVYDEGVAFSASTTSDSLFENATDAAFTNRNRVTAVLYFNTKTAGTDIGKDFDNAIFYNYDVHGNVKEMVQQNNALFVDGKDYHLKSVQYQYDLISGNVHQVTYQKGKPDQFIHRYNYDADNRITHVETSKDGDIWEKDAAYEYYEHGPLARTELGDKQSQGVDYAYTLQGWLKGVNSEALNTQADLGQDGHHVAGVGEHKDVARDAFGYTLNYFANDYKPRVAFGTTPFTYSTSTTAGGSGVDLYNGNIKQMVTAVRDLSTVSTANVFRSKNTYRYDQLNRIKSMSGFVIDNGNTPAATANHSSTYEYDANGNLMTLNRWAQNGSGTTVHIDELEYKYLPDDQNSFYKKRNRLLTVRDKKGEVFAGTDLKDQYAELGITNAALFDPTNSAHHNYVYDRLGQLVEDKTEGLTIEWRVDGKVAKVTKAAENKVITFDYDGLGNRLAKKVVTGNTVKTTYYTRDAQGNVMAVYESDGMYSEEFSSTAQNLYFVSGSINITELEQALNGIYVGGNEATPYVVTPSGNLTLEAGVEIELRPGFHAQANSDFLARINPALTNANSFSYALKEHHIYGSSRLGIENNHLVLTDEIPPLTANRLIDRNVGDKYYELSNHLGNILSVISDRKLPIYESGTSTLKYFTPDVFAYNDYYPFGMLMPNRKGSAGSYRYGFQGQEKDDELKGEGNSINYKFRMHDPRVGRFFAVDPLVHQYSYYSPYQFSGNTPIMSIELEGLEPKVENGKLVGYIIQAGQGPTQIAEDLNDPVTQKNFGYTLQKSINWETIVKQNEDYYKNAGHWGNSDMYDPNNIVWTKLNSNRDEVVNLVFYEETTKYTTSKPIYVTNTLTTGIEKNTNLKFTFKTIVEASVVNYGKWSVEAANDAQLGFWNRKYDAKYALGSGVGVGADIGIFKETRINAKAHFFLPGTSLKNSLTSNIRTISVVEYGGLVFGASLRAGGKYDQDRTRKYISGNGYGAGLSVGVGVPFVDAKDLEVVPLSRQDSIEIAKKDLKIPVEERKNYLKSIGIE